MAVHLANSAVQRGSVCSQGPPAAPACPGEALREGQPGFPDFAAACQSQDVARCLGLQTSHLRALVPGVTRRCCCQQLRRSFVARAIMEGNKTMDVAVSQDDLVALAPASRRHGLQLPPGPSASPALLPDASVLPWHMECVACSWAMWGFLILGHPLAFLEGKYPC